MHEKCVFVRDFSVLCSWKNFQEWTFFKVHDFVYARIAQWDAQTTPAQRHFYIDLSTYTHKLQENGRDQATDTFIHTCILCSNIHVYVCIHTCISSTDYMRRFSIRNWRKHTLPTRYSPVKKFRHIMYSLHWIHILMQFSLEQEFMRYRLWSL